MGDELHVVGVAADGRLLHTIRRPNRGWQEFRDVGRAAGRPGEAFAAASCAVVAGELHVCAVAKDGRLWHTVRRTNGDWQDFNDASREAKGPADFVQVAFNWIVENYPRLADWTASAHRLASLLVSLDRLEDAETSDADRITRTRAEDGALRLRDVCVTLDDGNAVVNEADIEITPGEKVLVVGESGTGKSMLVRAIAGLWPWGSGEILVADAGLFLMPQQPYVPLGTLRHAATYPLSADGIEDQMVRKTIEEVGLGHFLDRLDEDGEWGNVLSAGEKQRLTFARVLLQRPAVIVMDEATAALDPLSQGELMQLVLERLPRATIVSVAHRVELEAYPTRKLVLEYRPEGARLVGEDPLRRAFGRLARFLSKVWGQERAAKVGVET